MSDWDPGDFKRRHQKGVWHFLNRLMVALILFAVITLVICAFLPELRTQRQQAAEIERLKADIVKQKTLLAQKTRKVDLLKNNREYVEIMARDRLDLMKEGETIFRFPPRPADTSNMQQKE